MEPEYYWEDLAPGRTWPLGTLLMTETDIIEFAKRFDPQPFHIDPVRARQSSFGRLCASGSHTLVAAQRLGFDAVYSKGAVIAGMGVDRVRFIRPVFPDDVLSGTAEILSSRAHPSRHDRGLVVVGIDATNQAGESVASMETTVLLFRRTVAAR